jgi:hypothetical protein
VALVLLVAVVVVAAVSPGHASAARLATGLKMVARPHSCPASDLSEQRMVGTEAGAREERGRLLVPRGPSSILICRYNGTHNPPPINVPGKPAHGLVASALVRKRATITRIVDGLNEIPVRIGNIMISCPADFDRDLLVYFGYGSGEDYVYAVDIDGCQSILSGKVTRMGLNAAVIGELKALVPVRT